jgi:hypothetical protein
MPISTCPSRSVAQDDTQRKRIIHSYQISLRGRHLANPEHLAKLKEGVKPWNQWRVRNPEILPDLSEANLRGAKLSAPNLSRVNLSQANLRGADLRGGDLRGGDLREANLRAANLTDANLSRANLGWANLSGASLSGANLGRAVLFQATLYRADLSGASLSWVDLSGANLSAANLHGANLGRADLRHATLVGTNLEEANLTGCRVYGVSAWNLKLEGAIQSNLVITPRNESPIQVDNLEVAQFIYLLLNNEKIRSVIDTITSKVVLILGRFTPERKAVLDAIRDELRKRDYLPVLFDFEKPASRNLTETVSTLAHMARFVIADITDAKSIPQELMAIVPNMPSVPVQPLLLASQQEYGMFEHFRNYPWVLEEVVYDDQQTLLAELSEKVIAPAEAKAKELARK